MTGHRNVLGRVAAKLGCKIRWKRIGSNVPGYTYENHVIYNRFSESRETRDMCHELSHYMLCSSSRRKLPDFGLGEGPETCGQAPLKVTYEYSDKEEALASMLGICLFAQIVPVEQVLDLLNEHNWSNFLDRFWKTIADLNRLGYLDGNRVTFKIRIK